MAFKPIQKLNVSRTLSTGSSVAVGTLAQNRQGVFFQYDAEYVERFGNLSPFTLHDNDTLQPVPQSPHNGLHGVFADSLPDGWGLLLQDRIFRQHGILPTQVTAMDRLSFVGNRGMGALSYAPVSDYHPTADNAVDLATLGLEAQALFDGQTEDVLAALVAAGSSGGARPKAQVYFPPDDTSQCRTTAQPGDEAWLVKFTSHKLGLGHEEGLCEAAYLKMAELAGLQPPEWRLLDAPEKSGAPAWLAVKRFDWIAAETPGRLHMLSACGLLDADFRSPTLDYLDLVKASRQVCKSPAVGQLQFRRAMFNLFAANQDDHSKNWAFLQTDDGQWQPAPFYDATFSPHPFNEHATAFVGHGHAPPMKAVQKLATSAGYSNWKQAQEHIHEIVDVIASFADLAKDLGIRNDTIAAITAIHKDRRQENTALL